VGADSTRKPGKEDFALHCYKQMRKRPKHLSISYVSLSYSNTNTNFRDLTLDHSKRGTTPPPPPP